MTRRNARPTYRYDRVQRFFHWSMAAIIIVAIGIGIATSYMTPGTSPRRELLDIHKSLGMSALVLVVLRIAYRLWVGSPPYRQHLGRLNHMVASAAHLGLYGLMLFLPLSGYLFSAAGGYSLPWFGVFSWPRLLSRDMGLSQAGQHLHEWGAWIICAIVILHVLAAAWHGFVKRDDVLERMTATDRPSTATGGVPRLPGSAAGADQPLASSSSPQSG